MRPRWGFLALCVTEIVAWGLLYYSLPIATAPIEEDMGWSPTAITAAFSAGLIVSAVAGIGVGRILDARGPRVPMTTGAVIGVVGLLIVAWSPHFAVFILGWLVIGLAQSLVLYPAAFAVITRWYGIDRVRPLTTITLVGGLASTVFAPIIAFLIGELGWRMTYVVLAGILAVIVVPALGFTLNSRWEDEPATERPSETPAPKREEVRAITRTARFRILQVTLSISVLTTFAVTINIIPLLLERGMSYSAAAFSLGLVGLGQLVGRFGYAFLAARTTPRVRTAGVIASAAVGIWVLALLPSPLWLIVAFAILTGAARGCTTLLEATAVSDRWGTKNFGTVNGIFMAPMTALMAIAPVVGPFFASILGGYPVMAAAMAGLATLGVILATRT